MKYFTIQPPDTIRLYVRSFWVLEGDTPPYTHREIAGVYPELLFHYKGRFVELKPDGTVEKSFVSGIHGQSPTFSRFHIDESFAMFGVCLYPYTLPLLFGIPAYELSGRMPDVESVFGKEGRELEERMMAAANTYDRMRIAVSYLEHKLHKVGNGFPSYLSSVQSIIRMKGNIKIAGLAGVHNLSPRQFERKFKHFTGFNPKLFARLMRFYAAVDEYHNTPRKTLTRIALDCGYYDQSHFIQDFKIFSGHNPGDFFHKLAEGTEWLEAGSTRDS